MSALAYALIGLGVLVLAVAWGLARAAGRASRAEESEREGWAREWSE